MPEAGLRDSQVVLSLALQRKVSPPVLLMEKVWAAGLLPPCWVVKERLAELAPIEGLTDSTGIEDGEVNCANPGISAANLRIVRPPPPPSLEAGELAVLAAANGMAPVGVVAAAVDPVAGADDGAMLMVARGTAPPTLLLSGNGSLDCRVVLSFGSDSGGAGKALTGEEPDGEGSMDATGAFCGFRISRCSLRVEVCAFFFSKDFVGYRVGAMLSMRRA